MGKRKVASRIRIPVWFTNEDWFEPWTGVPDPKSACARYLNVLVYLWGTGHTETKELFMKWIEENKELAENIMNGTVKRDIAAK